MKKNILGLIAFFLISFPAAAQFEGLLNMKMTAGDKEMTHEMNYVMLIKHKMIAAETKGGSLEQGKFIFRGDKKLIWIINDAAKNYTEIPLKEDQKTHENIPDTKSSKSNIRKTGKTQNILGYLCDEWMVENGDQTISIWATSKLGSLYEDLAKTFGEMGKGKMKQGADWERDINKMKIFPLKIVNYDKGKITNTQEVTKIEAKSVPGSNFEPPAGYKKQSLGFDMNKMMEEMQEKMKKMKSGKDTSGNEKNE